MDNAFNQLFLPYQSPLLILICRQQKYLKTVIPWIKSKLLAGKKIDLRFLLNIIVLNSLKKSSFKIYG